MDGAMVEIIERFGVTAMVLIVMLLLVRQLMLWMQARIDAQAEQLELRNEQVMGLVRATTSAMQEHAAVTKAMAEEVRRLGDAVCSRLERIEERIQV